MTAPPSAVKTILKSNWDDLNDHLIAKFYEVDRKGKSIGNVEVWAPLTEANLEMALGWASQFENVGAQNAAPTASGMLGSGAIQDSLSNAKTGNTGWINQALEKSEGKIKKFEGLTGVTKLNSTQIFMGMQPVRIPVTALFRAWIDPVREVEAPIDQLVNWALPIELAPDGSMIGRAIAAARGKGQLTDVALPSKAPTMIAMRYKGKTYAPLVIESIAQPISSPVDSQGKHVSMLVPMTLCSLSAIDRADWANWQIRSDR